MIAQFLFKILLIIASIQTKNQKNFYLEILKRFHLRNKIREWKFCNVEI